MARTFHFFFVLIYLSVQISTLSPILSVRNFSSDSTPFRTIEMFSSPGESVIKKVDEKTSSYASLSRLGKQKVFMEIVVILATKVISVCEKSWAFFDRELYCELFSHNKVQYPLHEDGWGGEADEASAIFCRWEKLVNTNLIIIHSKFFLNGRDI